MVESTAWSRTVRPVPTESSIIDVSPVVLPEGAETPKLAESPAAARPRSAEVTPTPLRFAMAGHWMGRRRTVFAAVPIALVKPNPHQPRQHFDPETRHSTCQVTLPTGALLRHVKPRLTGEQQAPH